MGTGVDPAEMRLAVRASAARLALLLRSASRADAMALGTWNLADVAVHVSQVLQALTALARGAGPLIDDLWELPEFTATLVGDEGERDLNVLADRIEAGAATFVQVLEEVAGGPPRPWLVRGIDVRPELLAGQALSELVVHSWDIARAEGVRWPVPSRHAALVLEVFFFPVIGHLGHDLVDQEAAAGVRAAFDVRVRGGGGAVLRLDDGDLTVDGVVAAGVGGTDRKGGTGAGTKPAEPVDCHLSVHPGAFLLVAWGRRSQWPAIAQGQLLAWGRRPWLATRLRSLLRNP